VDKKELETLLEKCEKALSERMDKIPECREIPNIELQIEDLKKRLKKLKMSKPTRKKNCLTFLQE
jgi:hypothetical protein